MNFYDESENSENWKSYVSYVDDKSRIGFFFVDLGLAEFAPIEEKKFLIRFTLNFLQPDENGMPDDAESETLNAVEDSLATTMESTFNAVYPGHATLEGKCTFYFYVPNNTPRYEQTFNKIMSAFPDYLFEYKPAVFDPKWNCYFEYLLPEKE
ncbi:MAG: DUF695 domain-containing protein [Planctomycetaceae bacterium]|jgi:uncharacterized protein (TIGR01619 family)|nr:DUF695 domain-containing protein [Planctomycetaceae bacterium]